LSPEGRAELDENRAIYAKNRMILLQGLRAAGFERLAPADGAFYVYADISAFDWPAQDMARAMLEEAGVAVTPGLDFDPEEGTRALRFSYARSTADIEEGVARITAFMAAHAK
jgi:aspartate/methionine/tyrosine aminotransferase